MTHGQSLAIWQLREIANADSHALEIETIKEPLDADPYLRVTVNIILGPTESTETGLRLRERETFLLVIHPQFPFERPSVYINHKRFAGKPHVQWCYYLCLYQSSTAWNPSDGIFGLIDRLEYWLRKAALDQLDPEGEPLHPPAVYPDYTKGKLVIPKADTPSFQSPFWIGVAGILNLPNRVEIKAWFDINNIPIEDECALAILFAEPLPWEYPRRGADLFRECEKQGVKTDLLFQILRASAILTTKGQPLYFIFGSPMRSIAGGIRKQHLSVWAIDGQTTDYIRNTIVKTTDTPEITELRTDFQKSVIAYLEESSVAWCPVSEARPEVTIRRDEDSHLSYFRDKSVSIWGCGALGAHIAICLCRAGVRSLILRDNGIVKPGLLVRQPYFEDDVGSLKVTALKRHLLAIRPAESEPALEIEAFSENIQTQISLDSFDWAEGSDLIIDATASDLIRRKLEILLSNSQKTHRVSIATIMIDQKASTLITALTGEEYSGGPWDVLRKAKIELLRDNNNLTIVDGFFPAEAKHKPFQPEPGCSEPTFIGSAADSAGLASIGLNLIAAELARKASLSGISHSFTQPAGIVPSYIGSRRIEVEPDTVLKLSRHELRISKPAFREIKAWISKNRRIRSRNIETGGLLWGEWDDATNIIWVTDASGPPPDSEHTKISFDCGIEGTKEEHDARMKLTRQSVGYIGMWHTHPASLPFPSGRDFVGMHKILTSGPLPPRKNVLIIIGKQNGSDTLGGFVFRRLAGSQTHAFHEFDEGRTELQDFSL